MLPADAFAQAAHTLLGASQRLQAGALLDFRTEVRIEVRGMRNAGILPEAVLARLKQRTADALGARGAAAHLVLVTHDLVGDVAQWCIAEYYRPT